VATDGGGAGVVPPGWACEGEGGRIGVRGVGSPLRPASAQETDAQIISALAQLNVVATTPQNVCWLRLPMPDTNASPFPDVIKYRARAPKLQSSSHHSHGDRFGQDNVSYCVRACNKRRRLPLRSVPIDVAPEFLRGLRRSPQRRGRPTDGSEHGQGSEEV
jgi:hypothetical protein